MKSFRLLKSTSNDQKVLRGVALGCVVFGAFWLLVLSLEAWRPAAIFASLGVITAAGALLKRQDRADRIFLWAILVAGLAVFALALRARG